ncbi:MAG: hypothetical protein KDK36_08330 [Leptospiraceae bacterium]|nr:hypothetical protein [Leptospiraceae bacterium]
MNNKCEHCGMYIPSKYLDFKNLIRKCPSCGKVSKLSGYSKNSESKENSYGYKERLRLPKGMSIHMNNDSITLSFWWFRFKNLLVLFSSIVGVLQLIIILNHIKIGTFQPGKYYMISLNVFLCALIYSFLALLINKTVIVADRYYLKIQTSPLPMPGFMTSFPVKKIDQIYCTVKETGNKRETEFSYQVVAEMKGSKKDKVLIPHLAKKEEAQYIEYYLEKFLGIKDEEVWDELDKS